MLQVKDYRVEGSKVLVRLKCSCGGHRFIKRTEKGETYYACAACRARSTLARLKESATYYWRDHTWEVEAEEADDEIDP